MRHIHPSTSSVTAVPISEAESSEILKTERDECELQSIMQTILESYNSTTCEHDAVSWPELGIQLSF